MRRRSCPRPRRRGDGARAIGLGERRAADGGRQPQLVAAGHEHAGRVAHGARGVVVVRLVAGRGVDGPDLGRAQLRETRLRYISPASGPSEEALLMTAMRASGPPASATNGVRMTRSRTLSSAPPMTMMCPSGTN